MKPFIPIYCATKAAINSFTGSLQHQLKNTSVKVFENASPVVDIELGHDQRDDQAQSHGEMSIADFIATAMKVLKNDVFEVAIGMAKGLREKWDLLFDKMNNNAPDTLLTIINYN